MSWSGGGGRRIESGRLERSDGKVDAECLCWSQVGLGEWDGMSRELGMARRLGKASHVGAGSLPGSYQQTV